MKNIKNKAIDLLWYCIGGAIYSFAVTLFITPNEFSPGGLTGIATALGFLFKIPSGILLFILNIPILLLGYLKFGKFFILKTAIASVLVSGFLTFADVIIPTVKTDKILGAVFGGILMGVGLSIVMLRGATTGGVDILAKLINRKFRHLTVGKLILFMDAAVIALSTFVYRNIESALYSVVTIYVTSHIMDRMLYGSDKGKLIYIISDKANEIERGIIKEMRRGVTSLSARGGYTGKEKRVLLCSVRRHEVAAVYSIIDNEDPKAFVIVSEAGEIIGEGFKQSGFNNTHY